MFFQLICGQAGNQIHVFVILKPMSFVLIPCLLRLKPQKENIL